MATILSLDLGKFKTVCCWYEVGSGEAHFQTVASSRREIEQVLRTEAVDVVLCATCSGELEADREPVSVRPASVGTGWRQEPAE